MELFKAKTIADGWLQACQHLRGRPRWMDTTLVLHIDNPLCVPGPDRRIARTLDRFLVEHGYHSNHTVAETIFPGYEYVHRGAAGVYAYPTEIFPSIKTHPDTRRWGTYAQRLLSRVGTDGETYNPLESCINKMKQKRPVRASYELGLDLGFDLATYDDDLDRQSRLGGPCLSHLSFKLIGGVVHLTALYRSHFYVQRAFGNLLGLARLQSFVADQVEAEVGPLVCHSTMARLEFGSSEKFNKSEVGPLLDECLAQVVSSRPAADGTTPGCEHV